MKTFVLTMILILSLYACEKKDNVLNLNTNIHFIVANESVIDDSIDIKIQFDDRLLVDDIFTFNGSSTDYQFIDLTIPKGKYQILVRSNIANKQREEPYNFHENDYWFLIFYWNPRGTASPDNEFHFTIHNDTIKVG